MNESAGCVAIKEDRFFEKVLPHIGSPRQVFHELVQNAVRAKATEVRLEMTNGVYTATNDGEVLEDFSKLVVVADTGYDPDVERAHNPAGMGMILLYSVSEKVRFHSGDRLLTVDCARYFDDPEYRRTLPDRVERAGFRVEGMRVVITPKEGDRGMHEAWVRAATRHDDFAFYPLRVLIGGNEVERVTPGDYPVCVPGSGPLEHTLICVRLTAGDRVIWHGQPIRRAEHVRQWPIDIFVAGPNETFRPAFPDRRFLRNDRQELEELFAEAERQAREAIFAYLARLDEEGRHELLLKLLEKLRLPYEREWGAWSFYGKEYGALSWRTLERKEAASCGLYLEEEEIHLEAVETDGTASLEERRVRVPLPALAENFLVPRERIGGTPMPGWVRESLDGERAKVRVHLLEGGEMARFWVDGIRAQFVERIEIEDVGEADFLFVNVSEVFEPELFLVENADLSPLVTHLVEASDAYVDWDDLDEKIAADVEEAWMRFRRKANVAELWKFLEREGLADKGTAVTVTLDPQKGILTVGDKVFDAAFS